MLGALSKSLLNGLCCVSAQKRRQKGRREKNPWEKKNHFFPLPQVQPLTFFLFHVTFPKPLLKSTYSLVWICLNEGVGEWEPSLAAFWGSLSFWPKLAQLDGHLVTCLSGSAVLEVRPWRQTDPSVPFQGVFFFFESTRGFPILRETYPVQKNLIPSMGFGLLVELVHYLKKLLPKEMGNWLETQVHDVYTSGWERKT